MVARSQYSKEDVERAIGLARKLGPAGASRKLGINRKTIQEWSAFGPPKSFIRTQSDLLHELSEYIITHGPEIPAAKYESLSKTPGAYRRYWPTWAEFRNQAATLCPFAPEYNRRIFLEIKDGLLIGGGDWHIWPFWDKPTALRAMLHLSQLLKPTHVILNGDVPDFPQITHHRPIAWKKQPTLKDEFKAVEGVVKSIEESAPGAERYWVWGNHCIRFDNRLAEKNPEYADITGTRLTHHFPQWKFQNAIRINNHELEIKHRFKGGMYAVANNTKTAGISYWTGHDHNRQVYRWKDLRGVRYGVNPGMAADPWGPQFEYNENHPSNHDSGLVVVTFQNYKMMPPELVEVTEPGVIWFRGKRIEV